MFYFTAIFLALVILLGVIGILVTMTFPPPGLESLGQKLEQRMFQRAFLSAAIALGGLVALLTRALDPQDILIIAVASLILKEYLILKKIFSS